MLSPAHLTAAEAVLREKLFQEQARSSDVQSFKLLVGFLPWKNFCPNMVAILLYLGDFSEKPEAPRSKLPGSKYDQDY